MMRLARGLVWVIAAAGAGVFAVANRHDVAVGWDPFGGLTGGYVEAPLYAVVFGSGLLGVALGGAATWAGRWRWRRDVKRAARRAARGG